MLQHISAATADSSQRFCPGWTCYKIFDNRFLTPDWVLCSTFLSADVQDDPGDWHFQKTDFGFCPCVEVYDISTLHPIGPKSTPIAPLPNGFAHKNTLCAWRIQDVPKAPLLGAFHLPPASKPNLGPGMGGTIDGAYSPVEFRLECPLSMTQDAGAPHRASGVLSFVVNGTFMSFSSLREEHVSLQGSVPVDHLISLLETDQAVKAIPHLSSKDRDALRYKMRRLRGRNERSDALAGSSVSSTTSLRNSQESTPLFIPWSELSAVVDIRTSPTGMKTAAWGSRVIGINPCDFRCDGDIQLCYKIEALDLMEGVFTIYDYNPAALGRDHHSDFPLGTTRSLYSNGPCAMLNDLKTHTKDCSQPRMVPLPEFQYQRKRQTYKGARVIRDPIQLGHKQTTCALPFMWHSTHLTFDRPETLPKLLFDGDRIVFGTVRLKERSLRVSRAHVAESQRKYHHLLTDTTRV